MSEDGQWRDKYRDSLSRLSAEEARRSRLQSVLRILIGRLCVAGQGRDARLDVELRKGAEAVRKQVSLRRGAINSHLQEFRGREESRVKTYRQRVGRMRTRIRELERESHSLHGSLQEEQRLAMIDGLTGIPNPPA